MPQRQRGRVFAPVGDRGFSMADGCDTVFFPESGADKQDFMTP